MTEEKPVISTDVSEEKPTNVEEKAPMTQEEALSTSQIMKWKEQYGRIFKTQIEDTVIIWHLLKRKDYVDIMTNITTSDLIDNREIIYKRQEAVLKKTALYPTDLDKLIADYGCIATNIGGEIMDASGFSVPQTDEL